MKYNEKLLQTAHRQCYREIVFVAEFDAWTRFDSAFNKAFKEILENDSIHFDKRNRVLRFTSRFSQEQRIVTEFGCVASECPCKNQFSYHRALFEILDRYYQLLGDEPTEQPYIQKSLSTSKPEANLGRFCAV